MKKTEFISTLKDESQIEADEYLGSVFEQTESINVLTDFVPNSTKKTEKKDEYNIEYSWKDLKNNERQIQNSTLISNILFKKNEKLENLYQLGIADGSEEFSITHNNVTYVLRKAEEEVVNSVFSLASKLGGFVEKIVGFLKTTLNNFYLISRIDSPMWSFDKNISSGHISYIKPSILGDITKATICDMVAQKFGELHSQNFVFGTFNETNILFNSSDLQLSDLRKLRSARTKTSVVDEFISVLSVLLKSTLAKSDELYSSIAYYIGANSENCARWYQNKTGKRGTELEISEKILSEAG